MKNFKIIFYAMVFGIATVSCSSDTELSEEELKAANEAMKYNTINNPYYWNHWNTWPQNRWNNGMPGIKKIHFGKDLPSINKKTIDQSEEIIFGRK
ncbi:hypothetical protein ACMGDK_07825 [Chryseobacterium sp. DT-3]|uniref:hypothetical protein n=1 Tax=Chryseobacterium sp. DT-3 TaxID=3396164 RepID=UPI003F1AB664